MLNDHQYGITSHISFHKCITDMYILVFSFLSSSLNFGKIKNPSNLQLQSKAKIRYQGLFNFVLYSFHIINLVVQDVSFDGGVRK